MRWRRLAVWLGTPLGLIALFWIAYLIRLWLAPRTGLPNDLDLFRAWSERLARDGPAHFYDNAPADYPPGFLYVLWGIGKLSSWLSNGPPSYYVLKMTAVVSDLGLAWVVSELAVRLAPRTVIRGIPVRPLAAAAILFNPALIFESGVWGQIDAFPAAVVVGSFVFLFTGRRSFGRDVLGIAIFGAAVAIKPQAAFAAPVVAYALIQRYLSFGNLAEVREGAGRMIALGSVAAGVVIASAIPFSLGPVGLVRQYAYAASQYKVTTAGAFNAWGPAGFWKPDVGLGAVHVLGISAAYVGIAAFLVATVLVLVATAAALRGGADEKAVFVFGAAAMSLLAFTLLTRMHERYLLPAIAILAALVFLARFRWSLSILSLLFLANLYYVYVFFNDLRRVPTLRVDPLFSGLYGGLPQNTVQKKVIAAVVALACGFVAWRGWRWLPRADEPLVEPEGALASPPAAHAFAPREASA